MLKGKYALRIKSHEHFLNKLTKIFGDSIEFFDEYKLDDMGRKRFIKCKCNVDGNEWYGMLNNLYKGHGCIRCAARKRNDSSRTTIQDLKTSLPDYIELLMESKIQNNKQKIECRCNKHNVSFKQTISALKKGFYCYKCGTRRKGMTKKDFIKELNDKKFKYELLGVFKSISSKTEFRCTKHEINFIRSPREVLNDKGCRECSLDRLKKNLGHINKKYFENFPERKDVPATFYFLKFYNNEEVFYKLGITATSLQKRINKIQQESKRLYTIEIIYETTSSLYRCWEEEQYMLQFVIKSNKLNYVPKFKFGGRTECFKLYE